MNNRIAIMNNSFFKYLKIGNIEEKWGFYVTAMGYSKVEPHDPYPNQQHPQSHQLTWDRGRTLNDYYLVFISRGSGVFCSAHTDPKEITEGTCFFLFPGVWHRYKPDSKSGWEEYWLGFHGEYANLLMQNNFPDAKNPFINVGLSKELLVLFNKVTDYSKASFVGYPQQLAGLALQLLGIVKNALLNKQYEGNPTAKLISKAIFLLQESFDKPINVQSIAYELNMSYSAFRKSFKNITGHSPHQYHLELRLGRAKELLESTILNVDEIAEQTGFESAYYFSRLFKQKIGVSPKNYRINFLKAEVK
ncbi:AraC family transcriptional regulator [Niabella aquatica]